MARTGILLYIGLGMAMICGRVTGVRAEDRVAALHRRANALCDAGQLAQAITAYTEVIRLRPSSAEAHCDRGLAYRLGADYHHALTDFDRAIRLSPRYAAAYNNRAYTLRLMGRYDQAIAAYRAAIRVSPHSGARWMHLGACQRLAGRGADAIDSYGRALTLDPALNEARFNLGMVYALQGNEAKASALYGEAIRRARPEEVARARQEVESALKRYPDRPALRTALQMLDAPRR